MKPCLTKECVWVTVRYWSHPSPLISLTLAGDINDPGVTAAPASWDNKGLVIKMCLGVEWSLVLLQGYGGMTVPPGAS